MKFALKSFAAAAAAVVVAATFSGEAEAKKIRWKMHAAFGKNIAVIGPPPHRISEAVKRMSGGDFDIKVFEPGALTAREKSLIALAVAHAVQCPYCIDAYSKDCLEKGADLDQMTEAVHVSCAIRGGASLVHGVQMMGHVRKTGM